MSEPTDHEDEIEASRAPLLDHLIELRQRLIVCVAALAVGFVICFAFSTQIYYLLLHPYEVAAQILAAQRAAEAAAPHVGFVDGVLQFLHLKPAPPHQASTSGPFDLLLALVGLKEVPSVEGQNLKLIFTAPLEFFFTKLKLSGFGAVVLTFP
ncbi:MAG TPA: twin-arginine translocase subunit TatC, partial [Phenylobacterium sp.]|nr:twin-arginine translocase subunit TatC [Phenylobacterium sp.]